MRALMTAQAALRTILSEDASRRRGMTAQDDVGDGAALGQASSTGPVKSTARISARAGCSSHGL